MPNKIKCSASRKAGYQRYQAEKRQQKNKDNKLLRHMLKHPNDKQSEERRVPKSYVRRKPNDYWFETRQRNTSNVHKKY